LHADSMVQLYTKYKRPRMGKFKKFIKRTIQNVYNNYFEDFNK